MGDRETAVTARITGKVQGVGFRWWTRDRAAQLGLSGWVRNDPDGSVTAAFRGPPTAVAAILDDLRHGPRGAVVSGVETAPLPLSEVDAPGFTIRR